MILFKSEANEAFCELDVRKDVIKLASENHSELKAGMA